MGHANKIIARYDQRSDEAYLRNIQHLVDKVEKALNVWKY